MCKQPPPQTLGLEKNIKVVAISIPSGEFMSEPLILLRIAAIAGDHAIEVLGLQVGNISTTRNNEPWYTISITGQSPQNRAVLRLSLFLYPVSLKNSQP
jgi:hypothetical protein